MRSSERSAQVREEGAEKVNPFFTEDREKKFRSPDTRVWFPLATPSGWGWGSWLSVSCLHSRATLLETPG